MHFLIAARIRVKTKTFLFCHSLIIILLDFWFTLFLLSQLDYYQWPQRPCWPPLGLPLDVVGPAPLYKMWPPTKAMAASSPPFLATRFSASICSWQLVRQPQWWRDRLGLWRCSRLHSAHSSLGVWVRPGSESGSRVLARRLTTHPPPPYWYTVSAS